MTTNVSEQNIRELAHDNLHLLRPIAAKLHRWYGWVPVEDLESYVYLGLIKSADIYNDSFGVPFEYFACRKAMYLAIDEMRKDGILKRKNANQGPAVGPIEDTDIPDPSGAEGVSLFESKDLHKMLLEKLEDHDRRLLELRYNEEMTFGQIAEIFDISESAVCVRHKRLIAQMREHADHALAA